MENNENLLIGIIIPIFNSEIYLEKCINSIINQTYRKIKILLIDDGSSDNSVKICNKFIKIDNRITLIQQDHLGAMQARMTGINKIECDYVTFIDSDDYVDFNYIENLASYIVDNDMVTSGMNYVNKKIKDGILPGNYLIDEKSPIINNMIYMDDGITRGILTNMCGKIFKTSIAKRVIQDISNDIYYGEDGNFVYRYILECKNVCVTHYCGYYYIINPYSITHVIHNDYLINVNHLYLSLKDAFEKSNYKYLLIRQLQRWISAHIRRAQYIMGFKGYTEFSYIIPCKKEIANKNIIVYGAGNVGADYVRQIIKEKICSSFRVVAKNWNNKVKILNVEVEAPSVINEYNYDYILIAVNNDDVKKEMLMELDKIGVEKEKILAEKPLYIESFFS